MKQVEVARIVAEAITKQEIKEMLNNAKKYIVDWRVPSLNDRKITKGKYWNQKAKDITVDSDTTLDDKIGLITEFSPYMPERLKVIVADLKLRKNTLPEHEEPVLE